MLGRRRMLIMKTNHSNNKQTVEDLLKRLPKIQDKRSKQEILRNIEKEFQTIDDDTRPRKRKKLWIPVVATFCSIIVLLVVARSLDFDLIQRNNSSMDIAINESATEREYSSELPENDVIENNSVANSADRLLTDDSLFPFKNINEDTFSYSVEYIQKDNTIYTAWLVEDLSYIIPISLIDSEGLVTNLEDYYMKLDQFVQPETYGLRNLQLEKLDIQLDSAPNELEVIFNDTYPVTASSNHLQSFRKLISYMFRPYGYEKLKVSGNHPFVEKLSEHNMLSLMELQPVAYKKFQSSDKETTWLIPIEKGHISSFEEALTEMTLNESANEVLATVPNDAQIEVETKEDSVRAMIRSELLGNNQGTVTMIEAILMTAKSYGYDKVDLDIGYNRVGKYDLTKELTVPIQVNPIPIQ